MLAALPNDNLNTRQEDKRQFCTFWLSHRLFGVDIIDVKEISHEMTFTPIHHAPKEVKGYVNIRGQIHLVIDLRTLLGLEENVINDNNCVILFKQTVGEPFGVLVDNIGDIVKVSNDQIESRLKSVETINNNGFENANISNFIDCVSKLKNNILIVLNATYFLNNVCPSHT